ncbi:hypothetical protein AB0M54_31530 [Actinoplanes sp. NPDC051470]|uniref:hypothetical protein n=1 Tax=unclassified Actinoplanes TaxID=2626549 RepID=UPI00342ECE6E
MDSGGAAHEEAIAHLGKLFERLRSIKAIANETEAQVYDQWCALSSAFATEMMIKFRKETTHCPTTVAPAVTSFLAEATDIDRFAEEARDRGDVDEEVRWRALADKTRDRVARLEKLIA